MQNMITLAEATKLIPGRPSTNVAWRWCRRGLKARSGEVVRLKHRRVGGKIYLTEKAIGDFFETLAQADIEHFEQQDGFQNPNIKPDKLKHDRLEEAEQFLKKEGLL